MSRDASNLGRRTAGDIGRRKAPKQKTRGQGLSGRPKKTPDPLKDVDYTGNLETDSAKELTALEQGFRDRAKQEQDRFRLATDSEYWVAICFTSREDKEAFLRKHNLDSLGDKYLDGYDVDETLSN